MASPPSAPDYSGLAAYYQAGPNGFSPLKTIITAARAAEGRAPHSQKILDKLQTLAHVRMGQAGQKAFLAQLGYVDNYTDEVVTNKIGVALGHAARADNVDLDNMLKQAPASSAAAPATGIKIINSGAVNAVPEAPAQQLPAQTIKIAVLDVNGNPVDPKKAGASFAAVPLPNSQGSFYAAVAVGHRVDMYATKQPIDPKHVAAFRMGTKAGDYTLIDKNGREIPTHEMGALNISAKDNSIMLGLRGSKITYEGIRQITIESAIRNIDGNGSAPIMPPKKSPQLAAQY